MSAENTAVFLSYASQDAEAARRICEALRAAGVEVWFDQSELRGGDAWDVKIRNQIKECALFVPIISANTQTRREGYFRLEWRLADQRTHLMSHDTPFIVPVVIDETRDRDARVPESFVAVQWTPLPHGQVGAAFCERVKGLLNSGNGSPRESRGDVDRVLPASSRASGFGKVSAPSKRPWVLLLFAAAAVSAALLAFALRQTVSPPHPISPPSDVLRRAHESAQTPSSERASSPAVVALLARARALVRNTDVIRSDLDSAASLLEQAAKHEPTNARVWAERSLVDWRYLHEYLDRSMARVDSARRHAAQAMGIEPENPLARLAQAAAMTAVQRDPATKQRAIQLLEPIVDRITDRADGLYLLASLQTPEAALEVIDRAARMPGEGGRAHLNRASTFIRAGRMREADEAADHALAAERSVMALLAKSYYLTIWHGDSAESQRLHTEVPSEAWSEDFAASARYFVELWAGKPDRALAAMRALPREFIESYALSGPTGYYRGYALARANKPAAAETEWRTALAVVQRELVNRPNDQTLLTFSALLHWHLGDQPAALKVWQSLRELTGGGLISWENYFLQMTILPEEEAIAKLESLPPSGMFGLAANLRLNPYLDRFRKHPRFVALQAKRDADPRSSPNATVSAPTSPKSVAVLAFENRSSEKDSEYFSDGVSDELINVLGRVAGLKVIARTSSFAFKDKKAVSAPEIARALSVTHLVEGSVQQTGGRARVIARLIRADTGEQLWGDSFDAEVKDILTAQVTTARAIAEALALRLDAGPRIASLNSEAVKLYLQGRQEWGLRTTESMRRAEDLFTRAIALEPKFARAHSGLVDAWIILGQNNDTLGLFAQGDSAEMRRVVERARLAVALDPQSAEAQASLGGALDEAWQPGEARKALERALELNPNYATAHHWLGRVLLREGRAAEAIESLRRACELDPLSSRMADNLGIGLWLIGREQAGLIEIERALRLQPNSEQARAQRAMVLAAAGRRHEAVAQAREVLPVGGWLAMQAVYALAVTEHQEEAIRALAALPKTRALSRGALPLAALGRWDECLAALQPATMVPGVAHQMLFHPVFDPIRSGPRFISILETLGLTEAHARAQAWRAANPSQKASAKK